MKIGVIILAGGKGERFHEKKQDLIFHGKPLWKYVYDTANSLDCKKQIVVVGKDIPAGSTRSFSVINGLNYLSDDISRVIITEAARPLVTIEQLNTLIKEKSESCSFVMPLVNTIIGRDGKFFDRSSFYELLVPQVFNYSLLKKAYSTNKYLDMTDETRVLFEEYGIKPKLIETGQNLFKVTYPRDIGTLETIYQQMEQK